MGIVRENPFKLLENHFFAGTLNPVVFDPIVFKWHYRMTLVDFFPIEDFVLHTKVYLILKYGKLRAYKFAEGKKEKSSK